MDRRGGQEPGEQRPRQPELRLAVAMRGGVSLAIWMGGASLEIDRLRRSAGRRDDVYGELLDCAGYGTVVVDVLAGTSAGGLNAVLLGCSLAYDMRFDSGVRDLWLRVADIERLCRRPQDRLPRSVLQGDDAFYQQLLDGLDRLLPRELQTTDQRVDLILTGTLFEPRPDTFHQRIGQAITDTGSRARFRFRHFPERAAISDFRPAEAPPAAASSPWEPVLRLAYAARSTSSYPGAFEPARICAGRDDSCSQHPAGLWPFPGTMYGVFSESSSGSSEAKVIDGGVLDNIPIGWAIRSIAAARANQPVDRWLLYLQPVPPAAGLHDDARHRDARPGLLTVTRKAHDIKLSSESLLDDVDDLSRYEAAAAQRRRLARTLALTPLRLDELLEWAREALESYRGRQGEVEAARQARLLEEPAEVTGPDPLPFGGALDESRHGDHDDAVVAAFLAELRRDGGGDDLALAAEAMGCGLVELARRLRSPHALARTVATLLDWAGRLAQRAPHTTVTVEQEHRQEQWTLGEFAEQHLYHLRFAIEVLIAAHDRLVLRGFAHLEADDTPERVARDAAAALDEAVRRTGLKDDPMAAEKLTELCNSITGRSGPLPQGAWPEGGFDWLWAQLADQAAWLARAASGQPDLYPYLQAAVGEGQERMLEALVAMEVLFGPLRPDPLSETAAIKFHMVSAANLSPFDTEIFGDGPRGAEKLAGNQLNNFAAFLSARWRHNDWIWGRLDAARSLVELLARRDRIGDQDLPELQRLAERLGAPPSSAREQCVEAIVRHLHGQILVEELSLLAELEDAPPTDAVLAPKPHRQTDAEPAPEQLRLLGRIGGEEVRDRLSSWRRPLARAGLVLWRALQPDGRLLAQVVRVLCGLLKPLAVPLLGAVLAWSWMLGAAAAWFAAATLLTGDGWTWGHLPLVGIAIVCLLARPGRRTGGEERSRNPVSWILPVVGLLVVVLAEAQLLERPRIFGVALAGRVIGEDWLVNAPGLDGGDVAAAVVAAVGAWLAFGWLAPDRALVLAVAAAAVTLGLASSTDWDFLRRVLGPVFTYTQLALLALLFTWWFPGAGPVSAKPRPLHPTTLRARDPDAA